MVLPQTTSGFNIPARHPIIDNHHPSPTIYQQVLKFLSIYFVNTIIGTNPQVETSRRFTTLHTTEINDGHDVEALLSINDCIGVYPI